MFIDKKMYNYYLQQRNCYEEIEFSYNIPNNGFVKINEANIIIETEIMTINKYKAVKVDKII